MFTGLERGLLVAALDRAAHWTDEDIDCSDCRAGCCIDPDHIHDWADVMAWQELSRRLSGPL
ncbi:hypothetical protein [Catelliglobosispora koreensis]|uniref:hypothetical protein n=1 Tax=Catelliglobosispora koreensis TaxID=129052 RepID=UPI00037E098F|nr:hypothetical protein [Catelliglobosispora koreensis]